MIRISQIDDKFSIYKENTVILLGIGAGTKQLLDLFKYHKIEIDYICDNNKDNFGKVLDGLPIISPQHLQQLAQNENVLVQISTQNIDKGIVSQLRSIGVKYIVSFMEVFCVLTLMNKFQIVKENKHLINSMDEFIAANGLIKEKPRFWDYIYNNYNEKELIFLCLPPKTGDNTLLNTFSKNNIKHHMMNHNSFGADKKLMNNIPKKFKFITAVREEISLDVSVLYQDLWNMNSIFANFMLKTNKNNIFENGGDAQEFFDIRFQSNDSKSAISSFMMKFKENIIDISKYSFDKEKGYTIIKEGNIEVFVYQLEKMNDIVKEMSDWVGQTPFDEWVMGNEASGKWIADSYKQAQKEVKFSQEYFDRCYNDPWIQHFYSQEDIEKFKARWNSHIK